MHSNKGVLKQGELALELLIRTNGHLCLILQCQPQFYFSIIILAFSFCSSFSEISFLHIQIHIQLREAIAYLSRKVMQYTNVSITCTVQAKIAPGPRLNY